MNNQFVYFIPDLLRIDENVLREAGLDHLPVDSSFAMRVVYSGPNGRKGTTFVCWPKGTKEVQELQPGYWPDKQTWQECNEGKFWVGYFLNMKPTEESLRRFGSSINGHPITLADDQTWRIPPILMQSGNYSTPRGLKLIPDGRVLAYSLPQYSDLEAGADRIWNWWSSGMKGEISYSDVLGTIAAAMKQQYRLSLWEMSLLGLFTTDNIVEAATKVIDWPSYERMAEAVKESAEKKGGVGTEDGLSSVGGIEASIPTTSQQ